VAFRDVVGHRRLVALLARSIHHDSLPPSLILAGPSGVGKRLVAVATAQALNCPDRSETEAGIDACGVCPTCARIVRAVHPDVLLVQPGDSGSIKIDQVRDILDRVAYRPFEGRRRVIIIDDADALIPAAQNALLKTLEEPRPSSVFLLVTSRPDVLLPTVRSRCPLLRFHSLDENAVTAALVKLGRQEEEARSVAATSNGSVGRALDVSAGDVKEARDAALRALNHAAAADDPRRRIEAAKDLVGGAAGGKTDRDQLAASLRAMASLLRDVELASVGAGSAMSVDLANDDVRPAIGRLGAFRGDRGLRAFAAVDQALVALERNAGAKIVADWVVMQL
jgi:DNA polymerase-3 subunit delta'